MIRRPISQKYLIFILCFSFVTIVYEFTDIVFYKRIYFHIDNAIRSNYFDDEYPEFNESRLNFRKNILEFIEIADQVNVKVFLVDPKLIYQIIGSKYQNKLINRQLITEKIIDTKNKRKFCHSFGIFNEDIEIFKNKLSPVLINNKFSEILVEGLDGSKRNLKTSVTKLNTTLLHVFYRKSDDCIQLTVFHKRNDFLWTGRIPDSQTANIYRFNQKDIHFGKEESAFDCFRLYQLNIRANNLRLLLPEKSVHFLSQISSSKFIECNFDLAHNFHNKYEQGLTNSDLMNARVREGLIALKKFTSKLFMPFFITSGTLLGWYRQCSVIPYTFDMDTATWALYASEKIINDFIHNDVVLKMCYIYGLVDNGLQFALYTETDLRVDLFFTYRENDNLTYTGHDPGNKAYYRYIYPIFTLCSAELVGLKVLVPCNPEDVIRAEYGSTWAEPRKSGSFSFKNTGPIMHWTDEEFKKAYKYLTPFP